MVTRSLDHLDVLLRQWNVVADDIAAVLTRMEPRNDEMDAISPRSKERQLVQRGGCRVRVGCEGIRRAGRDRVRTSAEAPLAEQPVPFRRKDACPSAQLHQELGLYSAVDDGVGRAVRRTARNHGRILLTLRHAGTLPRTPSPDAAPVLSRE